MFMFSAGAALFCSALAQYLTTRDVELASEILCWVILPALIQLKNRYGTTGTTSNTLLVKTPSAVASTRAWLFALGLAAACWYRAEEHIVVLFPGLTPILLLSGVVPAASLMTDSKLFWPPVTAPWSSGLIAVLSCLVLVSSSGTRLPSLAVCVVVVALLYGGYLSISRPAVVVDRDAGDHGGQEGPDDAAEGAQVEDVAMPLAFRILPLLTVVACARMLTSKELKVALVKTVVAGFAKALNWFFTLKTIRQSSWCSASTIGTFAITSARTPSLGDRSFYLHAASNLVASLLALGQTIHMIPKGAGPRSRLWVLGVLPLKPLLENTLYQYPVEVLTRTAEAKFDAMLARQSRTYSAAVLEYRRRYNMEPPPGFEAWYSYAVARASPIIDEFDMIHEAIAPFWKMSGKKVREAMGEASGAAGADLWRCMFKGQTGETSCNHPHRGGTHIQETFGRWLGGLAGKLPDVEFLVNHLDEPRVLLPGPETANDQSIRLTNIARRPIWDTLTRSCSREVSSASSGIQGASVDINTHDLCQHPEYRDMHGMAMSPCSFILVDGPVPVLTTGTLTTGGDVLFPSPVYGEYGDEGFVYNDTRDVEWGQKRNNLYWAGSSTGAYAGDDGWNRYHRHRFVALAQGLESGREHWYLRRGRDGLFHRVASSSLNRDLFDVAFTAIIQCRHDLCESQREYFDVRLRADKDVALGSKLVFDIDGNGISGRFVKLLTSHSAVLKQTMLREWHDERLAAWVHYLPVSQGLGELPELVSWLRGTEEGRRRARLVAERGREWAMRAMRHEDRGLYVYRLMLELARIQDPERQAT
ncbi:glycosyltransferase family 90 protein [Parathielavia appendiculata]|uniref:Glycosyltransferase family 90 protein n=1 Tax=Parathielavia appendiculata TaxID=2587402 RepID=A0AAN6TYC7_9PEZI|nr:glycosyltransferase family 90 protein [Parathielavia appendiculata]